MITIKKRYDNLPFAHRQPKHSGHCALIHGHNWSFEFQFGATELDENGFVVDFGKLKWLRQWLEDNFDHTLVLNEDDPVLDYLTDCLLGSRAVGAEVQYTPLAKIVTVPNCGAEGLAMYVFTQVQLELELRYGGRVHLVAVTVYEDLKNTATFEAQ